ncbi:MAG: hypothetical protein FJW56_08285 [Actinobacteria bacterium]|nr:hypothetical protein [Actinomycetota bacterium]
MRIVERIFSILIAPIVILSSFIFFSTSLYAEDKSFNQSCGIEIAEETAGIIKIYIFYSIDCDSCSRVLDALEKLKLENPVLSLETYELSENNNAGILFYLFDKTGIKETDYEIPVIFLGKYVFLGEEQFNEKFKTRLEELLANNDFNDKTGEIIKKYHAENTEDKTLAEKNYIRIPVVVMSALADSINPCAIGVIIILISSIIASRNRKYALIAGITYIAVIFIVYFLLGIGFIYFTRSIQIPKLFFTVLGAILIILGLFSAKDFFWYQKGFSLGIPEPIKQVIGKNIYKTTLVSILLIGVLISIFEATCSGAVYFGILSLISQSGMKISSLLILALYNFIFILPLLVILIVFYFGIPARKVQRLFIQKNRRIYRLVLGAILIFLGIYLIVWL